MAKQKIIISSTEMDGGWQDVRVKLEDGTQIGNHYSSTIGFANFDAKHIVEQFFKEGNKESDYEVINNIKK